MTPELNVLDFAASLHFYTHLAGFNVVYDRPEEQFAMLELNGARLMIEAISAPTRSWITAPLERPFGRGMHLQIEVKEILPLHQRFVNEGYPIFFDLEEKGYRVNDSEIRQKQFLVQDPDGYLLRFIEIL